MADERAPRTIPIFPVCLVGCLTLDVVTAGINGPSEVSPWFPSVGLTLALLLILGRRHAPAVSVPPFHLLQFRDGFARTVAALVLVSVGRAPGRPDPAVLQFGRMGLRSRDCSSGCW